MTVAPGCLRGRGGLTSGTNRGLMPGVKGAQDMTARGSR